MMRKQKLINLYREMSALTSPECASTCRAPHSCCDRMYCDDARQWAKEKWRIDLTPEYKTEQKLPFMRENGCVVAPHLRPVCTVHTCQINGIGHKPGDPKWTKTYFSIRNKLDKIEWAEAYPE